MSLTNTPPSVRELQIALYVNAKANPAYCFYALYNKICRQDVLMWAWSCCRANGGSAGVDGESFAKIEVRGVEGWLKELAQELRTKTYRPQAVRRVNIPKGDGKTRPLGIVFHQIRLKDRFQHDDRCHLRHSFFRLFPTALPSGHLVIWSFCLRSVFVTDSGMSGDRCRKILAWLSSSPCLERARILVHPDHLP